MPGRRAGRAGRLRGTSPWAVEGLKYGERTFHVRATDAAKNLGAAQTRSFTVKLLPPGAAIYVANEGDDAGDCTKAKPCRPRARTRRPTTKAP